jgi:hypothetical protein
MARTSAAVIVPVTVPSGERQSALPPPPTEKDRHCPRDVPLADVDVGHHDLSRQPAIAQLIRQAGVPEFGAEAPCSLGEDRGGLLRPGQDGPEHGTWPHDWLGGRRYGQEEHRCQQQQSRERFHEVFSQSTTHPQTVIPYPTAQQPASPRPQGGVSGRKAATTGTANDQKPARV